jgi:hypothetical protein
MMGGTTKCCESRMRTGGELKGAEVKLARPGDVWHGSYCKVCTVLFPEKLMDQKPKS